jgi:hypothetical protein
LQTDNTNDWVRVTSDDGYSFVVRRRVANASETMRDMLDTAGAPLRLSCEAALVALTGMG